MSTMPGRKSPARVTRRFQFVGRPRLVERTAVNHVTLVSCQLAHSCLRKFRPIKHWVAA